MSIDLDLHHRTSPKISRRSYLAMIPVLNWKGGRNLEAERNIIKIIRKSDICKSNPILKTLLIENVRICCIVVETSGKQSGKILCASAPYILALISRANPKLGKMLKSEKLSSYLSILQRSDLESLLSNVYQTTIIIHSGVKKFYPVVSVRLLRDSFHCSEKTLLYLLNLILHGLQSSAEWFCDNVRPFICYLYSQNYELASFIANYIPQLIASSLKYSIVASVYSQKAVILIFQILGRIVYFLSGIVNHVCKDSSLNSLMKKMCLYLKVCVRYLRSTDVFSDIERSLLHFVFVSKPYVSKYFQKTFAAVTDLIRAYMPVLKDSVLYVLKEGFPLLRRYMNDNLVDILNAYHSIKIFLSEDRHRMTSLCCLSCRYFYISVVYLFNAFRAILPYLIQFSSNGIISLITCSNFVLDCCMYFCKVVCGCTASVLERHQELFCHMPRSFIDILKYVYRVVTEMQPYMVLIFRALFTELTKLTHLLAPTSLACLQEMNSSVFHASKEVVSKSCLAVNRILPSVYHTAKTVVPPTLQAAHEIIKSSSKSAAVVYLAIFRGISSIHPELGEGIVVLFMDGNKACLEVISVSFSASCELKDVALAISSNIPLFYRAFREVVTTTSYAAIEVSATSHSAKSRMLKDIRRAHDVVHTSFLLAEQEISAVYTEVMLEINIIISSSSETYFQGDNNPVFQKYVIDCLSDLFEMSLKTLNAITKFTVIVSNNVVGSFALYFRDFIKIVTCVNSCVFSALYLMSAKILGHKMCKDLSVVLIVSFCDICTTTKDRITSLGKYLCDNIYSNSPDINIIIMRYICVYMSEIWHAFKSSIRISWNSACHLAPQVWTILEHLASVIWDFYVENIPGMWLAWKSFCSAMWKVMNDLAPHVWKYSSSTAPVVWSSMRVLIKNLWSYSIDSSSFMWRHITSLSSEYWILSNTYLPCVWFAGCSGARKGWHVTCCLIENCWTLTVETCLLSWKFLHHSVAKTWRGSLAFTKTAYCVLTTSGSVLQKGFCICCKSKTRVCVLLKATPRISSLAGNSFRFLKLRSVLQLSGTSKEFNHPESDIPSSTHLRSGASINNHIYAFVNFFPSFEKLCNFETFIPSRMFRRNPI